MTGRMSINQDCDSTAPKISMDTRSRSFRLLWLAQTTSQVGSQVTMISVPLLAIVVLDAPAFWVAALTASGFLPYLLAGLHAGAYVDRWNRRRVMISCDIARASLLAMVPTLAVLGLLNVAVLLVVTFALGLCTLCQLSQS
jgi:MFS family permease